MQEGVREEETSHLLQRCVCVCVSGGRGDLCMDIFVCAVVCYVCM